MAISKGTSKTIAYKKEVTWGTLVTGTGAKQLRRVTGNFNLTKETYESGEIRTDRQVADFRHGVRSATGSLNGEMSANTYSDFMQSVIAKDFAAVADLTSLSFALAGPTLGLYTLTRSSGSWLSGGQQVGQVVRITTATGAAADNLNKNLLIASMTTLVLTVRVVNNSVMTASPSVTGATVATIGKATQIPATGHTEDSYTVEEFYSDIAQSEVYSGVKVGTMNVALPATGLTTVDFSFMGKDLAATGTTQYFTSPTVQGTNGILASVSGVMLVNGAPVALITSADFAVERAMENATAVGSNSIAEIFSGRIRVTGNLSIYFQDAVFRDYFNAESLVSIVMVLATNGTANSDFVSFTMPAVKLGSFTKDDGELGLVAQSSFTALLNATTGGGLPLSTFAVQDSTLV
jgi:hypothetical protein